MSPCSWAELVRELRFFWGSSGGDCSGIGLGTAALLALLSWLGGCIFGLICASLVFSHSCRRAYFFSSKAGLHFWDQTPLGILVRAQFNCALGWAAPRLWMSQSGAVEELTIQFGGLTLTLRNSVSGVTINSGQEAVPLAGPRAPATTAGPAVTRVSPWTEEWRSALCACEGTSCIFASALLLWGMVWRLRLHSRVISTFFHNLVIA